jgi:hypothetical protein
MITNIGVLEKPLMRVPQQEADKPLSRGCRCGRINPSHAEFCGDCGADVSCLNRMPPAPLPGETTKEYLRRCGPVGIMRRPNP